MNQQLLTSFQINVNFYQYSQRIMPVEEVEQIIPLLDNNHFHVRLRPYAREIMPRRVASRHARRKNDILSVVISRMIQMNYYIVASFTWEKWQKANRMPQ